MESLVLYRQAIALASLGQSADGTPLRIAEIYADLKALQEDQINRAKVAQFPAPNLPLD